MVRGEYMPSSKHVHHCQFGTAPHGPCECRCGAVNDADQAVHPHWVMPSQVKQAEWRGAQG